MQIEEGVILEGRVTGITKFGAFVELPDGKTGMVHISEVATTFVKDIRDHLTENQQVKVKVLGINEQGKISLSIKRVMSRAPQPRARAVSPARPGEFEWQPTTRSESSNFEDMLSKFKQASDEKMSDLKRSTEGKYGGFSRRARRNGG